eukprot:scaffold62541_cov64-Phaeocystis_antarctica.AAC.1
MRGRGATVGARQSLRGFALSTPRLLAACVATEQQPSCPPRSRCCPSSLLQLIPPAPDDTMRTPLQQGEATRLLLPPFRLLSACHRRANAANAYPRLPANSTHAPCSAQAHARARRCSCPASCFCCSVVRHALMSTSRLPSSGCAGCSASRTAAQSASSRSSERN